MILWRFRDQMERLYRTEGNPLVGDVVPRPPSQALLGTEYPRSSASPRAQPLGLWRISPLFWEVVLDSECFSSIWLGKRGLAGGRSGASRLCGHKRSLGPRENNVAAHFSAPSPRWRRDFRRECHCGERSRDRRLPTCLTHTPSHERRTRPLASRAASLAIPCPSDPFISGTAGMDL